MNEFKKRLRGVTGFLFNSENMAVFVAVFVTFLLIWLAETFKIVSLFFSVLFIFFVLYGFFYVIYNVLKFIYWLFIEPFIKK